MAKDAYYFSHDSNARNDPKILMLRADYGMEGLGFYWCLIEIMAEQADYKININDSRQVKAFALHLNSKTEFLLKLIEDCASEYGLFKNDNGLIYSESLLRRMQLKDAIREKRKKAGKKGGKAKANNSNDGQANAKQEPSKPEASEEQVSSNEKEKETKKKLKEMKEKNFSFFWDAYPNKKAKLKAESSFMKLDLTDDLFKSIMDGLEKHKNSPEWKKDNGQYIPHPSTWINQERWNDEIKTQQTGLTFTEIANGQGN